MLYIEVKTQKNIGITIRPYNEISAPRLENYSCFVRLVLN